MEPKDFQVTVEGVKADKRWAPMAERISKMIGQRPDDWDSKDSDAELEHIVGCANEDFARGSIQDNLPEGADVYDEFFNELNLQISDSEMYTMFL